MKMRSPLHRRGKRRSESGRLALGWVVEAAGKTYPLFGPIELDHYQIAEKLSATLGRPFRYEQ